MPDAGAKLTPGQWGFGPKHMPGDKEHIGRTLPQPPHEVRIPLSAERNVDAHAPALTHEALLQVAPNPVEHLEFEGIGSDLLAGREGLGFEDDVLVVRRQSMVNAALEQDLHQLYVVRIHLGLILESNAGGLFISPFAEPDANALGKQLFH